MDEKEYEKIRYAYKPSFMTNEEFDRGLKDSELFSAKDLILEEMINNPNFYENFMRELRFKFLFEKVKLKLNKGVSDE